MAALRLIRAGSLVIVAALLAGCAGQTGGLGGAFCDVAQPIRPAVSDVLAMTTKRQILAHDQYGQQACGWRP